MNPSGTTPPAIKPDDFLGLVVRMDSFCTAAAWDDSDQHQAMQLVASSMVQISRGVVALWSLGLWAPAFALRRSLAERETLLLACSLDRKFSTRYLAGIEDDGRGNQAKSTVREIIRSHLGDDEARRWMDERNRWEKGMLSGSVHGSAIWSAEALRLTQGTSTSEHLATANLLSCLCGAAQAILVSNPPGLQGTFEAAELIGWHSRLDLLAKAVLGEQPPPATI